MLRPNTMPAAPALVTARELDDLVLGLKLRAAETDHRHRTALDHHRHLQRAVRARRQTPSRPSGRPAATGAAAWRAVAGAPGCRGGPLPPGPPVGPAGKTARTGAPSRRRARN